MLLPKHVIDSFQRDGFVCTPGLLSAEELAHFTPHLDAEVARRTQGDTREVSAKSTYEQSFVQCMRLWETSSEVRPLTFHRSLAQAAAELLGVPRLRLWQDQALYKEAGGRETDAHQDQSFWPIGDAPLISAWIPLQPVRKTEGAMAYVPGSHKAGRLRPVDITHTTEPWNILEDPALGGAEPNWVEPEAGDVIWHHGFTVHQAAANRSAATRRVFTVVYIADGARRTKPWKLLPLDREGIEPGERIEGPGLPIVWPRGPEEPLPEPVHAPAQTAGAAALTTVETTARRYQRFAEIEARGRCSVYERLALMIAGSPVALEFLQQLEPAQQQPNLFLAALRTTVGLPNSEAELQDTLRTRGDAIRAVMLSRRTQTNEPARCAVLLPLLASLPQPLALIEVGASAGLCLLPDRYAYEYGTRQLGAQSEAPTFQCAANAATPLPHELPQVGFRAGLDLNPLDVTSSSEMDWLQALVWPSMTARAERLRAAIAVAQQDPPRVVAGDLQQDLDRILASVPAGLTTVVFHTAVVAYIEATEHREAFAARMRGADVQWISNEAPGVFPSMDAHLPEDRQRQDFVLSLNGQPMAWTGPHGQSIDWFG